MPSKTSKAERLEGERRSFWKDHFQDIRKITYLSQNPESKVMTFLTLDNAESRVELTAKNKKTIFFRGGQ